MSDLDVIDRKILYQLDINSRQSFSQIGKKIRQPKSKIAYRIKQLKQKGIIKQFYTVIDSFKLGYISFRIYLTFDIVNQKIKNEIIDYFVNNTYTWWVGKTEGRFDIVVVLWTKNINEFFAFWEETLNRYRKHIDKQFFSLYTQLYQYRYSFLLDYHPKEERNTNEITGGGKLIDYDETDMEILRFLANNSRIQITRLANELRLTSKTIRKRIKRLQDLNVILGYRVQLDHTKLGFVYYKVDIDLCDYKRKNEIISYIKYCPFLIFVDKSTGIADIELEFYVKDFQHLFEIINKLIDMFPESIKKYQYFYIQEIYKLQYLPSH
jgi:Lrp/AsnC family leucine-responsive transcriptional regulator